MLPIVQLPTPIVAMSSPNLASERRSCQLSYGWTITAFPLRANEVADRAVEFAQDFGFGPWQPEGVMTASLKPSNVPDYVLHAGIVPTACIQRYETDRIKQRSFEPTARPVKLNSSRLAGRDKGVVAAGRRMSVQHAPDAAGTNVLLQAPTALLN